MNKIIYKFSLLFLLALTGCSKDFLEVNPIGKISSDNFLNNDEEVRQALIGVYDIIQHNYSHGGWASVYFIKNLPADDCLAAGGGVGDQTEYQNLDDFTFTSASQKLETVWLNFYKTINACNTIINNVGAKEDITPAMAGMAAEAKTIRAFTYLDLVTLFGGVPLLTENPANTEEFHKPRASTEEVYQQIEKDLTEAIPVLPAKSAYADADKFRFSKGAAQAVLGKAYLYQKKYADASTVLGDIISRGEFSLEPDFSNVWDKSTEFGTESLFELSYTAQESYDWGTFPWGGGNENNIEVVLEGPRDSYFGLGTTTLNLTLGWGFNLPSAEIGNLFISEGETVRYTSTLLSAADYIATGGEVYATPFVDHDYEGFIRLKYVSKPTESSSEGVEWLNYTTNWRIIRYADVLLMAAEAYNRNNNDAAARTELQKVRVRAGFTDVITEGGEALFSLIKKERELELAFEGSRYWDLIRWGDAATELGDIGFVAGKHELFPIPLNEIIANNAISEADQNPGY